MKLIFKHLFRTVLRAPVQPLLILVTVALSTAIAITAFRLPTMFLAHLYEEYGHEAELGDLTVTLRGDSNTRMLFSEDAEAIVGEDGTVLGEFRLTGFYDGEDGLRTLEVSAVDLTQADAFYQFHYLEYGEFTTQNLRRSAVISASLAKELGLGVGDTLPVRVLQTEYPFTVQAVAADWGLLYDADLLIPITSVTQALAARVPAIASLGDSFSPYTRLFVSLNDAANASAVMDRLSSSPAFADKLVETTDAQTKIHSQQLIQSVALWIPALLLLILTALLVGTSLKLQQSARSTEYGIFRACGADTRFLGWMQMGESLAYALLGGLGGVLLSSPLLYAASMVYFWQTEPLTTGVDGAVFGLAWAVILMLLSTCLHLRTVRRNAARAGVSDGRETVAMSNRRLSWTVTVLTSLAFVSIFFTPSQYRYLTGSLTLLFLVWWIYLLAPLPLFALCGLTERLLARLRRPIPSLFLTSKNLRQSAPLRQVVRLSVLLCTILLTIFTCSSVLGRQDDQLKDFIVADSIVVNVNDELERSVKDADGVLAALRFSYHPSVELDSGAVVPGVSLSEAANACVSHEMLPTRTPAADEIAIATGVASMEGVGVGDRLAVSVKGCRGEFTVCEIVDANANLVFFDASMLGIKNDMMCVLTDEAHDREALMTLVEPYGAAIVDTDVIFGTLAQTLDGYLTLLDDAIVIAIAVTLAGVVNLLAEQYRVRRTDLAVLRLCGMTRLGILRACAAELTVILVYVLAVSLPLSLLLCRVIDLGARSFGLALFL